MSLFSISENKEKALLERMEKLGVKEEDLRETFVRSSGSGGQKVNKTSSCVYLVHVPTGLSVKCQQERSQAMNRFIARRLLLDRIERIKKGRASAERKRIEKIKRQKRRRSKKAREKVLQMKHAQSEKKALRSKNITIDE
ncbi:MAG: peptide chain release factor-like protein [Deltaproteobacteria bacterium]|nr:peptide chain release factor-like protein [Deltaproteobacteria bacterium]MBN2844769.1 peptide chain release factor-like protein [Deltaproteobacteria bacterium]